MHHVKMGEVLCIALLLKLTPVDLWQSDCCHLAGKNGQTERRKDIHYHHGYPFLWIIHHKLSLGIWISVGFRRKVASLPSVERFALGFATSTQLRLCSRADQKQQDRDGLTPLDYLKSQGVNVT